MTIEVLALFGIEIERGDSAFCIKGNQCYRSPEDVTAEGDWSNAAFFLCMGALGGPVSLRGLSPQSTQGDKEVMEILKRFGAEVNEEDLSQRHEGTEGRGEGGGGEEFGTGVCTVSGGDLHGTTIDASQIPDLVPALAVVASVAEGETVIYNAQRLRIKESDRIQSTFDLLSGLGADVKMTDDGLVIRGKKRLLGGTVDGAGDHRIVMAAATAACVCENPVVNLGYKAVNKSYPSFFEDFRAIGGVANVV
jgi:3-phosphoshikimate 1-carboxyvinyltransferase